MTLPADFSTARCRIRRHLPYDAEAVFTAFGHDPEVALFLGWKPHLTVADTRRQLGYETHRWDRGAAYTWLIELNESAEIAGLIQLVPQGHQARLGYLLARKHWGKGLMTEALAPVLTAALARFHRVDAVCDVDNPGSARVLEKIGMQQEGRLRRYILHPNIADTPRDVFIYSAIR